MKMSSKIKLIILVCIRNLVGNQMLGNFYMESMLLKQNLRLTILLLKQNPELNNLKKLNLVHRKLKLTILKLLDLNQSITQ